MTDQPIEHFETSAKEATSVEEAFRTIAGSALQKGQEDDMYVLSTAEAAATASGLTHVALVAAATYLRRSISVAHYRNGRARHAARP